jgi:uncharacterized protein YndB with AHSA1/START domain
MKTEINTDAESPTSGTWTRAIEARVHLDPAQSAALPGRRRERRFAGPRHVAIQAQRRYSASPARVFAAWLDPRIAANWLFATALCPMAHVKIDARVGGAFRFVEGHGGHSSVYAGNYLEIVAHRRLAFTLWLGPRPDVDTRVTIDIAPVRNGCQLSLTHENVPRYHLRQLEGRWTGILYGLGETLDALSQFLIASRSAS